MRVMLVSVPRMPADTRTARATPPQGGYATVPVPWSTFDYIERRSVTEPDAPLIVEADGITHTYADAAHAIGEWSGWLDQESGRRLVRVAGLLENTAVPHLLRVAAAHAGVAYTSLSPLLRGKTLLDALDRSGITDVVVSGDDALRRLGLDARVGDLPESLVVHRNVARDIAFTPSGARDWMAPPERWPRPCHTLVYTSGTSGPAKPVRIPAELMATYGRMLFGDRPRTWPDSGYYSPWHPAHVLGAVALEAAISRGLRLILRRKFDPDAFWTDVVDHSCRLTVLISVANSVMARRESAPAEHPLELVGVSPALSDYRAFEDAFGVEVINIYGMTELGTVLTAGAPQDRLMIGTPSAQYRCRVLPLPEVPEVPGLLPGDQIGELAVAPVGLRTSYEPGMEPLSAWHDGWFHTGDIVVDHDGAYRFVGRAKDTIRRRGRNISAHDLEEEVRALPGVCDCACVSYPDLDDSDAGGGDDEIRLFVVPVEPDAVDAEALVEALMKQVPRFMVPRYVDVVRALPWTPSGRLSRNALRELPLTASTYNRKQVG
jgi:crotonobetaine/carnitine-CoA ligase